MTQTALPPGVQLRPLAPGDSFGELTALVHRAYAPLLAAGLNFTAATQTEAMTVARTGDGHCLLALRDGCVVGTVTVARPHDANRHAWARATAWYLRDDVAHLHQFAVDPAAQGTGLGTALMQAAEAHALASGRRAIALDTALPATHLRQRYARAGYAEQHELHWEGKTYRSVVMLKPLSAPAVSAADAEHRVATVRAFWAHYQARDWAAARALLADDARLYWRASGEHLDDADAIVRVNAIYPEGWRIHLHQASALLDGRVHSLAEVVHGADRFLAHTLWRFDGQGRIVHADETFATKEAPPAWRTAEAIGAYRREALDASP